MERRGEGRVCQMVPPPPLPHFPLTQFEEAPLLAEIFEGEKNPFRGSLLKKLFYVRIIELVDEKITIISPRFIILQSFFFRDQFSSMDCPPPLIPFL